MNVNTHYNYANTDTSSYYSDESSEKYNYYATEHYDSSAFIVTSAKKTALVLHLAFYVITNYMITMESY